MKTMLSIALILLVWFHPGEAWTETNIFKMGEDVTVERDMRVKSVVSIKGQITVSGKVDGHVIAIGDSIVLTKSATVDGNVIAIGGIVVQGKGAEVTGTITEINSSNISDVITTMLSDDWEGWSWIQAIFSITVFFCTLLIGLILVVLLPKQIRRVAGAIQTHTWKSTWWGILGLILIVPLFILLTISVIGIVLIPLEIILVTCGGFMGLIAVSRLIGAKVYALFKRTGQPMLRETFWGLIILWMIGWIPVVGWMIKVCAITIGLGAVIFTRFGTAADRIDHPPPSGIESR